MVQPRSTLIAVAAAALLACPDLKSGASGTAAGTSGTSTGEIPGVGETTAPETGAEDTSLLTSATSSSSTSEGPPEDMLECNPWLEDCPQGLKCRPYLIPNIGFEGTKCMPPGDDPIGAPCDGDVLGSFDTCEQHAVCYNWIAEQEPVCVSLCNAPRNSCPPLTQCLVEQGGIFAYCLPGCDPLANHCLEQVCVPANEPGNWTCVIPTAAGKFGDDCSGAGSCAALHVCAEPNSAMECNPQANGCCTALCDLDNPQCPGVGQVCVPWYADEAPPTLADLGVCRVP